MPLHALTADDYLNLPTGSTATCPTSNKSYVKVALEPHSSLTWQCRESGRTYSSFTMSGVKRSVIAS